MRSLTFYLVALEALSISTHAPLAASIDVKHEHSDSLNSDVPTNLPVDNDVCSLASCPPSENYGVDISFPIHHGIRDFDNELSATSKRQLYKRFMDGCQSKYSAKKHACRHNEMDRMEMNLQQPKSMFNYTAIGFSKTRAPSALMTDLRKFWANNVINSSNVEAWPVGNTYTNHWESPTRMLNLEDRSLVGSVDALRSKIWDATKDILQQWTGVQLSPTSLYGIRIYTDGAVLAPHVDRNPLVISAIINVAQDVKEDWPLEVIGHDGKAYNVTMEVGDMILYESHSVIHGRPFPLNGEFFANVFCHFEPRAYSLMKGQRVDDDSFALESLYQQAWDRQRKKYARKCGTDKQCYDNEHSDFNTVEMLPPYISPESREGYRWRARQAHKKIDFEMMLAHVAAADGDLKSLMQIAAADLDAIKHVDANGWNPLHEAVRGGHVHVVSYLLSNGLDINKRSHGGDGGSPLWWAIQTHGNNHSVVKYLESNGAMKIAPK